VKIIKKLLMPICCILIFSCQRAELPAETRITIQIPKANTNKIGTLATINYSLLCFAVNVKGSRIPTIKNSCDIESGIRTGSVAPGESLTIEAVPIGAELSFEVYGILRSNSSEPCPVVDSNSWNYNLGKIYSVGGISSYKVTKVFEELMVPITLPETSANLAQVNSIPATCFPVPENARIRNRVSLGTLNGSSTNFKIYSTVSIKDEHKVLTGTNLKIRNWKAGGTP
jgi:hypothetical protein